MPSLGVGQIYFLTQSKFSFRDLGMMNTLVTRWMVALMISTGSVGMAETLQPGDAIHLTLRGVPADEQQKISGDYTVGDDGKVSLPMLEQLVRAKGLTPNGFARVVEKTYKAAGIYAFPAVDVVSGKGKNPQGAIVSVGGQVQRAGQVAFRQGMTVIQALDAVGGRNPFGGRNILLLRNGRQYCIDFRKLAHKSIVLEANDSLQVEMKPALIDRWKGNEEALSPLRAR
jgi:protein involved in polysaccharide export with SLBB domain